MAIAFPYLYPNMSNSLLGAYFRFLRSPNLTRPPEDISTRKALGAVLKLYSLHWVIIAFVGIAIALFSNALDSNNLDALLTDMNALWLFFVVAIAVPLAEECVFRLPLRPYRMNLALSASLLIWFAIPLAGLPRSFSIVCAAILVSLSVYFWLKDRRTKTRVLQSFYSQHSLLIFYCSVGLFGIVHITNYDLRVWFLLPMLVMPQLILGLLLGFVRLRYGFGWTFFLHGFHNGCVFLPFVLFQLLGSPQLQSDGLDGIDTANLSLSDSLLVGGIGLYALAGVALCLIGIWKVVREWSENR